MAPPDGYMSAGVSVAHAQSPSPVKQKMIGLCTLKVFNLKYSILLYYDNPKSTSAQPSFQINFLIIIKFLIELIKNFPDFSHLIFFIHIQGISTDIFLCRNLCCLPSSPNIIILISSLPPIIILIYLVHFPNIGIKSTRRSSC